MNIRDEIAKVAYEIWEKSGRVPGREVENWLEAEQIVIARHQELRKSKEGTKKTVAKKTTKKVISQKEAGKTR